MICIIEIWYPFQWFDILFNRLDNSDLTFAIKTSLLSLPLDLYSGIKSRIITPLPLWPTVRPLVWEAKHNVHTWREGLTNTLFCTYYFNFPIIITIDLRSKCLKFLILSTTYNSEELFKWTERNIWTHCVHCFQVYNIFFVDKLFCY